MRTKKGALWGFHREPTVCGMAESEASAWCGTSCVEAARSHWWQAASAILVCIGISVASTQLAALLLETSNWPVAFTCYEVVVTPLCIAAVALPIDRRWLALPSRTMLVQFGIVLVCATLDLVCTNIALSTISVALEQSVKAMKPFVVVIIESLLACRVNHPLIYTTVALVTVGTLLVATGDYSSDPQDFIAVTVAMLATSVKYIFYPKLMTEHKEPTHPLGLLLWIDVGMAPIAAIWAGAAGEFPSFFESVFGSWKLFGQVTGVSMLSGLKALSQVVVLKLVSATSFAVASEFSDTINIVLSITATQAHWLTLTSTVVSGIVMVIVFSGVYAYLQMDERALPAVDRALGCADARGCAGRPEPSGGRPPSEGTPLHQDWTEEEGEKAGKAVP